MSELVSVKDLIKAGKIVEAKEAAELALLDKNYIHTDLFGWITKKEYEWLNTKLLEYGYVEKADTLEYIPATQEFDSRGNVATLVRPFIIEFEQRREEINNDGFAK